MNIQANFDTHRYGCVEVDTRQGILKILDRELALSRGDANIVAIFVDLANSSNQRASLKTMTELLGASTEASFKARLSKLRAKLRGFGICDSVTASSFLLSDRLMGEVDDDTLEKQPYHLNVDLADKLLKGSMDLDGVRIKARATIGGVVDEEAFKAALGPKSTPVMPTV